MRAHSIGKRAARQDLCFFCAFRSAFKTSVPTTAKPSPLLRDRNVRHLSSSSSKSQPPAAAAAERKDDEPEVRSVSGWGGIAQVFGGSDLEKRLDADSIAKSETTSEGRGQRRQLPSAHLRDIIPPRVADKATPQWQKTASRHYDPRVGTYNKRPSFLSRGENSSDQSVAPNPRPSFSNQGESGGDSSHAKMRGLKIRRHEVPDLGRQGRSEQSINHGRGASSDWLKSLGFDKDPLTNSSVSELPVTSTQVVRRDGTASTEQEYARFGAKVPWRGAVGGLEDLLGTVEKNAIQSKERASTRSQEPRRKSYHDFEASSQRSEYRWTPDTDPISSKDEEPSRDAGIGEVDERPSRRSERFVTETADPLAPHPAIPTRARGRGSSRRDFIEEYDPVGDDDAFEDDDRSRKKKGKKSKKSAPTVQTDAHVQGRPQVLIPDFVSVENLSKLLRVRIEAFIQRLEEMGFESPAHDHILDSETAGLIATEYNLEPILATSATADLVPRPAPEDKSVLPPRPPIITIMGHVDHGKTTILDYLRKSSIVASEHGGITQHIGAFSVRMPGVDRPMTFLDTPGHAAFLEMRRRGATVTDIVVLVVAADDGVKPQTIEAIKHALDANVQIIVAINKIDKHDANAETVKQELTRYGIEVEDVGGNIQAISLSGKTGQGMQDLEEAILALAEAEDYRAEMDGPAEGWVIEANVTLAGRLATVLVRRGTMRPGDIVVAGTTWARIRSIRDDTGAIIEEAPPGTPVQIDGWRDQPLAGFEVLQAESEHHAKQVVEMRLEREEMARMTGDASAINAARKEEAEQRARVLAWEAEQEWAKWRVGRRPKDNAGWVEPEEDDGMKKVNLVVKADVTGSVEAVVHAVSSLGNNEVRANVIRSAVGPVNLSDIQHVSATGGPGCIVSFNQSIDGEMYRLAESAGVQILDQNIIYRMTDAVKEKLVEQLPPIVTQRVLGEAEIGQVFEISVKKETMKIAGCKVTNGTISRDRLIRVSRYNQVVFNGKLSSLKNVKKDVTEMRKGTECGMAFEHWADFMEGDTIQSYEEIKEQRKL